VRTGARSYWLEITTGDLNGERVEGPGFASVPAALNYLRNLCAQIDSRELRRACWADILYFQIVLPKGVRSGGAQRPRARRAPSEADGAT